MSGNHILVVARDSVLVRDVESALGDGYVVTCHDQAGDVEEFVELKGPFDLLLAGPLFDTRIGLERLRRLRANHRDLPVVLVFDKPSQSPIGDIVRVGASDLVELPVDQRRLQSAILNALEAGVVAPAPAVEDRRATESIAEVFSVASPSGGCGKTFYSTNLAHWLQETTGQRVCLVDLDLQFGEVSAALRLKPRYTIVDAVTRSEDEQEDLETYIEEYLVKHPSGFWVLPAPRHPVEADRVGPPDVAKVIAALRRHFGYLVLDTSAQLSEIVLTALDQSTSLVCMATLDLPSIRNMRVFLETLDRLNIPADRVSVILNKVEPDMGIRVSEANEALHNKVVAVLPYAREVTRSINQGQPVLVSAPRAEISKKLIAGMQGRMAIVESQRVVDAEAPWDGVERRRGGDRRRGAHAPAPKRRRWFFPFRRKTS